MDITELMSEHGKCFVLAFLNCAKWQFVRKVL